MTLPERPRTLAEAWEVAVRRRVREVESVGRCGALIPRRRGLPPQVVCGMPGTHLGHDQRPRCARHLACEGAQ